MKKILFAIVAVMMITGCTVSKQVSREQVNAASQSESKEATTESLHRKAAADVLTITNSRTLESVDTIFTTPGSEITGEKAFSDLVNGKAFCIETQTLKGVVLLDSLTGKVSLSIREKPQSFPFRYNKISDTRQESRVSVNETEDLQSKATRQQRASSSLKSNLVVKDVKRTLPWGWGIVVIAIATIAGVAIYLIRKRVL